MLFKRISGIKGVNGLGAEYSPGEIMRLWVKHSRTSFHNTWKSGLLGERKEYEENYRGWECDDKAAKD